MYKEINGISKGHRMNLFSERVLERFPGSAEWVKPGLYPGYEWVK